MLFFSKLLHKINTRWKMIFNYFALYQTYRNSSQGHQIGNKSVYVNLDDRRIGHYYYILLFFLEQAGYNIFLKYNFWFIANCMNQDKFIFSLKRLKIISTLKPSQDLIYIYDQRAQKRFPEPLAFQKNIEISPDIFSYTENDPHALSIPFGMHPYMYHFGYFKQIPLLRRNKRKMRIFFSGNLKREAYDDAIFKNFFKKMNRIEMIHTLKVELAEAECLLLNHPIDFSQEDSPYQKKMVLSEWTWSPQETFQFYNRIKFDNWLEYLSYADFFLACPGIRMPFSHNVIESMALGTIPILEYAEQFFPPLQHQVNAIVFKGKEDLLTKIREVLELPPEKIQTLRANVIDYYEKYLKGEAFVEKLTQHPSRNVRALMYVNVISVQTYLKKKNNH